MDNIIRYDYSKLLGKIREKGMTQVELAKEIGISEATLNFSLKNKRPFKQDEIIRICEILGINLESVETYFFNRKL